MNLDLRDYETFPAEVSIDIEADNADYGVEGVAFRDVMSLRLNIQKVSEEYFCQGFVTVPVEQECARCLSIFETELSGEMHFAIRAHAGKSIMGTNKDADVITVKSHEPVVELNELIRQALSLSIPMKPLCSEECRGLCPNCGVNLNEEECDCKEEDIDDRWEGLQGLVE